MEIKPEIGDFGIKSWVTWLRLCVGGKAVVNGAEANLLSSSPKQAFL
jgi:hypothetical protein